MHAAFGSIQSAIDVVPITLSDASANIYRGFIILDAAGGTLRITTENGNVRTLTNLLPGIPYMFATTKIHFTATTVTTVFGIV